MAVDAVQREPLSMQIPNNRENYRESVQFQEQFAVRYCAIMLIAYRFSRVCFSSCAQRNREIFSLYQGTGFPDTGFRLAMLSVPAVVPSATSVKTV